MTREEWERRELSIRRAQEEIYRLRYEIANCAHCATLKGMIVRLMDCIPPEPVQTDKGVYYYVGPLRELPESLLRERPEWFK